jgi:hypothetical protein
MHQRLHDTVSQTQPPQNGSSTAALEELRRIRVAVERIAELVDEGFGAALNAAFPYGDGSTDKWGRRG